MKFVYAVAFAGGNFVMVRHKNRSWEMPGGSLLPDETSEDAVKREFHEETGMSFLPVSRTTLHRGTVYFGFAKGRPHDISDEIAEVAFFERLPPTLSFEREEYESMVQRGRHEVKKYIKGDFIGDSAPSD